MLIEKSSSIPVLDSASFGTFDCQLTEHYKKRGNQRGKEGLERDQGDGEGGWKGRKGEERMVEIGGGGDQKLNSIYMRENWIETYNILSFRWKPYFFQYFYTHENLCIYNNLSIQEKIMKNKLNYIECWSPVLHQNVV